MHRTIPMHRLIPCVEGGRLYQPETGADPLLVGTSAWYAWLEHHSSFIFIDLVGTFTARKIGTDPGSQDWEASCTRAGRLYHVSMGPSHALTLARLQAVAAASMLSAPTISSDVGPLTPLMRTKLSQPRTSGDVIPRARLIERLNAGLSSKVTLLSAPAGFGKTTLLVEWLETIDRPTVWLALDEHDNDLVVFVHYLTAALQTVFPDACLATASLLKAAPFPSPDRVATLFINELADLPEDVMLVLDDYHTIHHSAVHILLDLLIKHMPPQLHLVLATRSDPPLPLAKWQAQGQLNELRGTDLRFTLDETQAFLAHVLGNELALQAAGALEEGTKGWIAVLRLVALSPRNASDPAAFLERLHSHPDRYVSSYLVEEILAQQAPATQQVLLRSSILDPFCAALCEATIGADVPPDNVRASLDWLEGTNVFIVPLDEQPGWYCYHPLFKRLLEQHLLERVSTEEVAMLHRRASAWYASQGLMEQAIEHALAAGDATGAAQLVEGQISWAIEQEQWVQMERWLHQLPEEQRQGSPGLLVASAWISQVRGQWEGIPPLLTAAKQLLGTSGCGMSDPDDPQLKVLHAEIAVLWSAFQFFTGQTQASLQSARCALEWLPAGHEFVASTALMYLTLSTQASGQKDVALVALQQALRAPPARPTITARLLFAQALLYLAEGKLPQLEHTVQHLLRLAQEADLALSQYCAHWLLGYVEYEWNRLDASVSHFSTVITNRHAAPWLTVREALYGLACAHQAQGLGTQAKETIGVLLELVQGQHHMSHLTPVYAFHARLALLQDEVESAQQWLEMAGDQQVLDPMLSLEVPAITYAWMLLAKADEPSVQQGQEMLDKLLQHAQAIHNRPKTIQLLALQALAYDLQGLLPQALDVLERALVMGRPAGFIRTFADVTPLIKLLQELRKRRKTCQAVDKQLDGYLQRILAAMRPLGSPAGSTPELLRQEGIEPLTGRELQILRLLDKNLTNQEIARELVLTPGTVKVHTNNVYRKLSVNNRRAAVALSRALGLLAAD